MARLLVTVLVLLALVGCSGGPGVITLDIDPLTAEVEQGQTARFTVNVTGTSNTAVQWTTTGGHLVAKGAGATFVALEPGSFEVTATSQANPSVTATAAIVVTPVQGRAHIRFTTDGSMLVAGAGASRRVEVEVVDEEGNIVDSGQVSWSTSDPAAVTVLADGARAAEITTHTSETSQVQVSASWEGLSAAASLLITQPSPGTVLIDSATVLEKTETSVTLVRDPLTEALVPGQRVVSGSRAGVLVEVESVELSAGEVVISTNDTSLAAAFDELGFSGDVAPLEVTVQLLDGTTAVVSIPTVDGPPRAATILDDVTCTSGGAAAPVDLVGTTITVTATIYGELAFSVFLGDDHFLAKFGASVQVEAATGGVTVGGAMSETIVCSLELPRVGLEPLSAGVATLWTGFIPVLGVEVGITGVGTSLTLSGPKGGLGASLEGGVEYTEVLGWQPLFASDFSAEFEPFSASVSFEDPLSARVAPFGRIDVGMSLDLGVGEFATPLIDGRFVELKGFGYIDFELPGPMEVGNKGYSGPAWTLGTGVRGALKAEFQGLLPQLLDFLGIDVNFAGQLELFHKELELLTNPSLSFLATPAEVEIPAGGSTPVTLTAFTSDDADGTVSFWAARDGAAVLTFLTSAALEDGSASTTWLVTQAGDYELYARMSTDAASLVKPYAANNTATVSATEEEGDADKGLLGNEGPFRGYYTHFSLGQCDSIGVAVTIDFLENPDGELSGTYVGHYCTDGCLDIEPYPTGPVSGSLSGSRSGSGVVFALSAPVGGVFTGERWVPAAPPGSSSLPVIDGFAEGVAPCDDEYGTFNSGFFSFVGTEGIEF